MHLSDVWATLAGLMAFMGHSVAVFLCFISMIQVVPTRATPTPPAVGYAVPECGKVYNTHSEALQACSDVSPTWRLATPKSLEEQAYVRSVAAKCYGSTYIAVDGSWSAISVIFQWYDGVPVASNQWGPGEPNGFANEPCIELRDTNLLNDCSCSSSAGAVCQDRLCTSMDIPCTPSNTVSMSGTPPRCACECLADWGGLRCDLRVCTNVTDCRGHALSVSGLAPNCSCACTQPYIGRNCRTPTPSLSLTDTISRSTSASWSGASPSHSPSTSATGSQSSSKSYTKSSSFSTSTSASVTLSLSWSSTGSLSRKSRSASPSLSYSYSTSRSISSSRSATVTSSRSDSYSPPTLSSTLSYSLSTSRSATIGPPTESVSTTHTCLPLDGLDVNDTCTILRPLRVPFWSANASDAPVGLEWMYAGYTPTTNATSTEVNASFAGCTLIRVPYSVWTGRKGSSHAIGIVASDYRVPLKPHPPLPDLLDSPPSISVKNISVVGSMVVLFVQYDGSPTLNSLKYRFTCLGWARCPVPMDGVFEVELLESERLFPPDVAQAVEALGQVSSFGGVFMMIPTTVVQLGIVGSLKSMSRCQSAGIEDDDGETFNGGLLNPLGMRIGGGGKGAGYARGAVVMSFVYMAVFALVMAGYTTTSYRVALWMAGSGRATSALATLSSALVGFPSILLAGMAFAMDGTIGAGVTLGAYAPEVGDAAFGWISVSLCVVYLGHILLVTTRLFPLGAVGITSNPEGVEQLVSTTTKNINDDLHLLDTDSDDDIPNGRNSSRPTRMSRLWEWLVLPTDHWELPDKTLFPEEHARAEAWQVRYNYYVADMRVGWYCCLEQSTAVLVCLFSALEYEVVGYCVGKAVSCGLVLGAQALVMAVRRPVVYRWRWLLMSIVLSLQTGVAFVAAVNAVEQTQKAELAIDSLGAGVSLLLFCSAAADFGLVVKEHYRMWAATLRRIRAALADLRRQRGRRPVIALERPIITEDAEFRRDVPTAELEMAEVPDEDDMARATREILQSLREYEERLEVETTLNSFSTLPIGEKL